jgi:hypothetical protein
VRELKELEIKDAKIVLNGMQSYCVGHIKRKANFTGHYLVEVAANQSLDQIWMKDFFSFI